MQRFKQWVKSDDSPHARMLYKLAMYLLHFELPATKTIGKILLIIHKTICGIVESLLRVCYFTPMFKSYVENEAKQLYLFGGLPYISGPLRIRIGQRSRISGATTFTGRTKISEKFSQPLLDIGSNVDIGWQTSIAVGSVVRLGDNVRIAGQCLIAGYPGHPLDPQARAQGEPELDTQVGDVILEEDVWLATGVSVLAGVTIGQGAVIAAGSVVTKNIPAGVIAAGVPAKVIRKITIDEDKQ